MHIAFTTFALKDPFRGVSLRYLHKWNLVLQTEGIGIETIECVWKQLQLGTTYGNLPVMAGWDLVDVWKDPQESPSLSKKLQNISTVELLLGERNTSSD